MSEEMKRCPFCGEEILAIARKCKHCGSDLGTKILEKAESLKQTTDYGMFLLAIPVVATILIWFWVSGMNLFQSPSNTMSLIMLLTVIGTAIVAAMEASKVGMKSDSKQGTYSPTEWFFIITLLWVIGYPIYLFKRRKYGLDNRLVLGIFVTLIFVGSWSIMYSTIEEKKTEIRGKLEQITTQKPIIQTENQETIIPEPVVQSTAEQEKVVVQEPVTQPVIQETAIQVSSVQIASDYEQNEARADSIYKGKLLQVTGTITSISKDFSDDTVVRLQTTNTFQDVHAELEKSEEQKAINLQKGNEVTVQCRGAGEVVSSPMLNKCILTPQSAKTDIAPPPPKQTTITEQPSQPEIPVSQMQQSEPEPTTGIDTNKTWTGDWGNGIIATVSSEPCQNKELVNQDYDYLMTVTIPVARLKSPDDAWQVLEGKAVTITGCWSKRDWNMIHAKLTRKKGNKTWEQDFKLDDGNWTNQSDNKSTHETTKSQSKNPLDEANAQINVVWNATTKEIRAALLPEQRVWLKQRENDCSLAAKAKEQTDTTAQNTIKINCMAKMTNLRTEVLKQKIAVLSK